MSGDFRVQGKLGLDGAGFFSTLNKAEGAAMKLGTMLAGAFSVGAITSFSKSVLDLAGNLRDVSDALNINVEWLQKFINSAVTSGGSLQDVEKFLVTSMRNRQSALDSPDSAMGRSFTRLGFSQNDIANLNPQQFMERLIEAFRGGASAEMINSLVEIGGKSAKNLIGGFKAGLDESVLIMTDDVIDSLDEIGDKFSQLGTSLKVFLAPAITAVADAVTGAVNLIKQSVAMVGAFMGRVYGDSQTGGTTLGQTLKRAMNEAIQAQATTEREQDERAARDAETRAQARSARRQQQQESAGLTAAAKEAERTKATSAGSIASDSRVAVGGFLGQGASMALGAIAERQLQVARQTLLVQRDILTAINSMTRMNSLSSLIIPQ
jgi:hypothetical protein